MPKYIHRGRLRAKVIELYYQTCRAFNEHCASEGAMPYVVKSDCVKCKGFVERCAAFAEIIKLLGGKVGRGDNTSEVMNGAKQI